MESRRPRLLKNSRGGCSLLFLAGVRYVGSRGATQLTQDLERTSPGPGPLIVEAARREAS